MVSLDQLTETQTRKTVALLCDYDSDEFEQTYLGVREKEARVLDDKQVMALPTADISNPHYKEWQIRQHSAEQVASYLKQREFKKTDWVLDIGCGNGWFTNILAKNVEANVVGIDINMTELEQAFRVFKQDNLYFAYLDLLRCPPEPGQFSHIFINSCFQYFENPKALLDLCLTLLSEGGEIHILDSPFYAATEVEGAKVRSQDYYQQLEFEQMGQYYHHHNLGLFDDYNSEFLYQPAPKADRKGPVSPFPWLKISQ